MAMFSERKNRHLNGGLSAGGNHCISRKGVCKCTVYGGLDTVCRVQTCSLQKPRCSLCKSACTRMNQDKYWLELTHTLGGALIHCEKTKGTHCTGIWVNTVQLRLFKREGYKGSPLQKWDPCVKEKNLASNYLCLTFSLICKVSLVFSLLKYIK